ncbi:MAG: GtrA family protein [Synechococcus sp. SB0678_bin_12]|nr:GtrA family protein [Synechococcus sp. SB0678_bin_12]
MGKAVFWDRLVSLLERITGRLVSRRVISFALVGLSGTVVHAGLFLVFRTWGWSFLHSQSVAIAAGASSNYWVNNSLTFRSRCLRGRALFLGLIKFLLVCSPGLMANILVSTVTYTNTSRQGLGIGALVAGIVVDFIWKYTASSRFVWKTRN